MATIDARVPVWGTIKGIIARSRATARSSRRAMMPFIVPQTSTRASLRLDQPWPVQYWEFISGAARLDFGQSIKARRPVTELIGPKIMNSLKLGAAGMLITLLTGIPLGVIAAVKRDTFVDTGANLIAVLGQSLPQFWVGIMLIQVFTVQLGLLPASGTG